MPRNGPRVFVLIADLTGVPAIAQRPGRWVGLMVKILANSVSSTEFARMLTANIIERPADRSRIAGLLEAFPVVGVLGARQVGKTTLARMIAGTFDGPVHWFDLEDPRDAARLSDPMLALESLEGLVVLDEIQRAPGTFSALRVLADRATHAVSRQLTRFLVLGNASPDLIRQSAETLAGRIAYHELGPFQLSEVGASELDQLWTRGGIPAVVSGHKRLVERRLAETVHHDLSRARPAAARPQPPIANTSSLLDDVGA